MYVPSSRRIISSYDIVFNESFSIALEYTLQPYTEAMTIRTAVTYTPNVTSLREQTGNMITSAQFEEGNILNKTRNDAETSDNDSIMPPLPNEEEMDAMDSGNESDHELISMEMLEDICDGSQSHLNINQGEACYKIRYCIRQRKLE